MACRENCRFDEVRFNLPRDAARSVAPVQLPPGFSLEKDGREVLLRGPEPQGPVRFKIGVGPSVKIEKLDFEVRRGGQVLLSRKGFVPQVVPPPQPIGSLRGVVQVPPQISPGELIQLEVLDPAKVPPGGRWILAGQVVEPERELQDAVDLSLPSTPGQDAAQGEAVARCLAAALVDTQSTIWKNYNSIKSNTAGIAASPVDVKRLGNVEGVAVRCQTSPDSPEGPLKAAINTSRSNIKQMITSKAAAPAGVFSFTGPGGKPEIFAVLLEPAGKEMRGGRSYRVETVPPPSRGDAQPASRTVADEGVEVVPGVAIRGRNVEYTFAVSPGSGGARGEAVVLSMPGAPGQSAVWRESMASCLSAALLESQSAVWKNYNNVKSNTAGIVATPVEIGTLGGDTMVTGVVCRTSTDQCSGETVSRMTAINTSRSNIRQIPTRSAAAFSLNSGGSEEVFVVSLEQGERKKPAGSGERPYRVARGGGAASPTQDAGKDGVIAYRFSIQPADLPKPGPGTILARVPEGLKPGTPVSLVYTDVFGDRLVDIPAVEGVEVVPEQPREPKPRITAVTPRVFAGDLACVCGSFPDRRSWHGLMFDRDSLGAPVSASSRTVWVRVPAGAPLGDHVVSGAPAAGYGPSDQAATKVIRISGRIDANLLMRGQSTPIELQVEGTDQPVEIRVRNLTPSIISMEGGDDQVLRTSGGSPNKVQRTARGLTRGDFNIDYQLAGAPCPCVQDRR